MRIAHVVSTYPPYRGGMGNVARELALRTAARGHEVVVCAPSAPIAWRFADTGTSHVKIRGDLCTTLEEHGRENLHEINDREKSGGSVGESSGGSVGESNGARYIRPRYVRPWLRYGNAAWCPGIRRALERLQPDIVHLHWPFIGGFTPVISWRLHDGNQRRRLIVQHHMDLVADGWRGVVFRWYQRRTLPFLAHFADRMVVSSRDYAEHGALAPDCAAMGDRLIEIPLGVDAVRFASTAEAGRRRSERAAMHILFVGGLDRSHAFKGLRVLLHAFVDIDKSALRIVGDGDLRPVYEREVARGGIRDRVTFLGSLPESDLIREYQSADILVLPSTARSEAFGLVLLEAMACGTPVIASDLPGVRTVVTPETGFLVPPGDPRALVAALRTFAARTGADRHVMAAAARARTVECYDWERIVDRWMRVYETIT